MADFEIGDIVKIMTNEVPYNGLSVEPGTLGTITNISEQPVYGTIPLQNYVEYPRAREGSLYCSNNDRGWWFADYQLALVRSGRLILPDPDFSLEEMELAEGVLSQMA